MAKVQAGYRLLVKAPQSGFTGTILTKAGEQAASRIEASGGNETHGFLTGCHPFKRSCRGGNPEHQIGAIVMLDALTGEQKPLDRQRGQSVTQILKVRGNWAKFSQ